MEIPENFIITRFWITSEIIGFLIFYILQFFLTTIIYSFLLTDLRNTKQSKDLSYVLCLYAGIYVSLCTECSYQEFMFQ